jgi:hypothetical protein
MNTLYVAVPFQLSLYQKVVISTLEITCLEINKWIMHFFDS